MKEFIKKAKEIYKGESSGHDFGHIKRVLNYCKEIQKQEGGDLYVITIAALFHDVHRVMQNKTGKYVEAVESIPYVKEILINLNVDKTKLDTILYIIEKHENKTEQFELLELNILIDADILDALGKVGLKRTLRFCKTHNIPLSNSKFSLDAKEYVPEFNPLSTKHYIYRTMIPNFNLLRTETAKLIGLKKVAVLEKFIKTH